MCYDVEWVDPATGEATAAKNFKSDKQSFDPPDTKHDWVLHVSREGRKEGMLKSWKFESQPFLLQEVGDGTAEDPIEIVQPAKEEDIHERSSAIRGKAKAGDARDTDDDVLVDR